jgi:outer membrane protein
LSSTVTVFEGFSLYNSLRQSNYEYIASKYDVEKMQNDVSLNVVTAYLQVLYNQELLNTAKRQLETSAKQSERTKRLYESGVLPKGSFLDAEAQEATEELSVVSAQNQLDISYLTLTQLLDLPSPKDFKVEDPQFNAPSNFVLETPEAIFDYAVKNQPEIKSVDYKVLSAKKGLHSARGGISPRFGISSSIGSGYSDNRERVIGFNSNLVPVTEIVPFSDQLHDNLSKSIGFNLTVPIFNGWQTKTNIGRAKINMKNAELSAQIAKNQLSKTIQQAHADANASYKKYTATTKSLEALKEAFKYTEQKMNAGLVNTIDYLNAKNNLNKAESDLLQAKYDYIFKTKVLDFYLGKPLVF